MSFLKNIGPTELIIVAVIAFVLFGGKKMSEFARGLGESGKELKKVKKEMTQAIDEVKKPISDDNKEEQEKGGVDNV